MSDVLEIRQARPSEYDAVGDLTVRGYLHDGFLGPEDAYVGELRDAAVRAAEAELWVALRGRSLVGTVTFCPPGSLHRELARDGEGEFRMLAVEPADQGTGIARALVGRCFERSADLGLADIVICSMQEMAAAHALYGTFGFVRDESLDWEPVPGLPLWGFRAPVRGSRSRTST